MNIRVPSFSLVMALFLYFRYLRANRKMATLLGNFTFMGVTIYYAQGNIWFTIFVAGLIILQVYIVVLKFKNDPRITRFQAGYKPSETILHYVGFALALSILFLVTR